jgi:hypothetical protein
MVSKSLLSCDGRSLLNRLTRDAGPFSASSVSLQNSLLATAEDARTIVAVNMRMDT